ncbi:MAG: phosphoglycerate mutase [Nitrospinae bacterium]|nr:phosphoglycerate mutase [Nitrospinota bacterium]
MKYLIVIANGLTDDPIAEKDNKTPLQLADTPNLDRLARLGRSGMVHTIPETLHAGSDVSFLSLLGYDPERYYAGPAYFEAAALNVKLDGDDFPLCCDFVILQSSHNDMVMKDYAAGGISSDDANLLLDALRKQIVDVSVDFYPGNGYHNLMVVKNRLLARTGVLKTGPAGPMKNGGVPPPDGPAAPARLTPPDELIGEGIRRHMPADDAHKELAYIVNQAQIILHHHPLNKERRRRGLDPVNSIWPWGNGGRPDLPSFESGNRKTASAVSASSLFTGMAVCAGMKVVPAQGAAGSMDADGLGKVRAATDELRARDAVYLQVSACEEVSLHGNLDDKILAIEDFDREVVGPLLSALEGRNDVKILLVVSHVSSAVLMKYKKDPVPFVVYPARRGPDGTERFDEDILKAASERFRDGPALIQALFKGEL